MGNHKATDRVIKCSQPGCLRAAASYNGEKPVCGKHFVLALQPQLSRLPSF